MSVPALPGVLGLPPPDVGAATLDPVLRLPLLYLPAQVPREEGRPHPFCLGGGGWHLGRGKLQEDTRPGYRLSRLSMKAGSFRRCEREGEGATAEGAATSVD